MEREKYKRYFEILELPADATLPEVRRAYVLLKELYANGSIASFPVEDDIPEGSRNQILQDIEDAFNRLMQLFREEKASPEEDMAAILSDITEFSGYALREIRERLGIDLHDVAMATNIQIRDLKDMEAEKFESLPPDVYTRGFVVSYAKYLTLDTKRVADDYMSRYYAWKARKGD
jgi:flagellar biosynthesis protein FlhG